MKELNFKKKDEWYIRNNNEYSIQVVAWHSLLSGWIWNVYVNIFDSNPLFNHVDNVMDLPFHGGCSYSELKTFQDARDKSAKIYETLVVGCDYNHECDDYFNEYNPIDGIPPKIKNDVSELIEAIEKLQSELNNENK